MFDVKVHQNKVLRFVSAVMMFMAISLSANAEFFIGADAADYKLELTFQNGTDHYDINPGRLRLGWSGKYGGVELNALTDSDKTITSFTATQDKYEIENAYGLFLHFRDKNGYIRLGGMWMDTTFSTSLTGFPTVTDKSSVFLRSIGLGFEFEVLPHVNLHIDYTYMSGRTDYPSIVSGTGNTGIKMTGFGAGVSVAF